MRILRFLLAGALLGLAPFAAIADGADAAPASPETVEAVLTMPVEGTVDIEKDGAVSGYTLATPVDAQTAALLDKEIRSWLFQPVVIDGAPVRAQSRMRITLAATRTADGYDVRIDNEVFPPPEGTQEQAPQSASGHVLFLPSKLRPPAYPEALNRAGVSGSVLLGLRLSPDGRVQDVVAVQTMLYDLQSGGHDKQMAKAIRMLEESAIDTARHWRANLKVQDGVMPSASELSAYTCVDYISWQDRNRQEQPGKWRMVSRTPVRAMPWLPKDEAQHVGVADLQGGEVLPLASGRRLRKPAGAAL